MANNQKFQLHEVLDPLYLESLAEQFADKPSSAPGIPGEFDFAEFQEVLNEYIVPNVSTNKLEDIFARLDFKSTGVSTWHSFLLYLQNEIEVKNQKILVGSNVEAAVSETIKIMHTEVHEDVICRIDTMPLNPMQMSEKELGNHRYVTISREGTLATWSPSWKLNKSININEPMESFRYVKNLLLDMVCMPNVNLIGISCTDDRVRFFDAQNLNLLFILNGFVATVTVMTYWFDRLEPDHGILLLGDTAGSVTIMHFTDCLVNSAFGPHPFKNKIKTISMNDIMAGIKSYIHVKKYKNLHSDWVKQVRYEPFLKSVMSCSSTSQRSLIIIRQGLLAREDWAFNVPHGINCFDFNAESNLLATGGIDRVIRIWNPYVTNKPMASFVGHGSPVTFLFYPDNQLFSISTDKILKVWDTREEKCIQNLSLVNILVGSSPVSSAFYNTYKRLFFIAANKVCVVQRLARECDLLSSNVNGFVSHPTPVTGIVYSKVYNLIVSVCLYGLITIWDLDKGHRVVQIQRAHFHLQGAVEIPASISAVCLNECGKRLITCGSDSYLKIWNLGCGCMLINSILIPEQQSILTLLSINDNIYFAGCSRRIYSCDITQEVLRLNIWNVYHRDDIMSLSHLHDHTLVSCSWDGNICTWRMENELRQSFTLSTFLSKQTFRLVACRASINTSNINNAHSSKSLSFSNNINTTSGCRRKEPKGKISTKSEQQEKGKIFTPRSTLSTTESPTACVCVLCLEARAIGSRVGNLLAADTMGRIQVWSSTSPSSALAVFASVMSEHHYTTCMTTDSQNKYLITGDSNGFMRVWYIRYYCLDVFNVKTKNVVAQLSHPEVLKFPFCRRKLKMVAAKAEQKLQFLTPNELSGKLMVEHPLLLSSYRAHVRAISGIVLVESKEVIITSSGDKSVRLWTLHGRFIGIFGDPRNWDLIKLVTPPIKSKDRKIPGDIRRVSSATTLQVLFSGLSKRWWKIRELFLLTYMRAILRRKNKIDEPAINQNKIDESVINDKVTATMLAARNRSRKIVTESNTGPPLGECFCLLSKNVPDIPEITSEQLKNSLTIIHQYIPCYELENISLQNSQRIMSTLSTERAKTRRLSRYQKRSRTFSTMSKFSFTLSSSKQ